MPRKSSSFLLTIVLILSVTRGLTAQSSGAADLQCSLVSLAHCAGLEISGPVLETLLENPETLNEALKKLTEASRLSKPLGDLSFKFKTFYVADSTRTALGLSYAYKKSIARTAITNGPVEQSGFNLSVDAQGNVAFKHDVNPRDFLDSKLALHFFRSHGGATKVPQALTDTLLKIVDTLSRIKDQQAYDNSPVLRTALGVISGYLSTQVYTDLAVAGSFETNQAFDQKQYTFGGTLGIDLKAWNKNSALAHLNLFDWPFAIIRYLTGTDTELAPRGTTIPTLLLGFSMVDPTKNLARQALGQLKSYPRFNLEAAFRTPVTKYGDQTILVESDFRYYTEIGPSAAVKAANLAEFLYFVGALTASNGMFVSYSTGRLPFDAREDQVYELGFKFKF